MVHKETKAFDLYLKSKQNKKFTYANDFIDDKSVEGFRFRIEQEDLPFIYGEVVFTKEWSVVSAYMAIEHVGKRLEQKILTFMNHQNAGLFEGTLSLLPGEHESNGEKGVCWQIMNRYWDTNRLKPEHILQQAEMVTEMMIKTEKKLANIIAAK